MNRVSLNDSCVKTSIFYINDFHGKTINMERAVTASDDFNSRNKNNNTDSLKLSSGDIMVGEDIKTNQLAILFQNIIGITSTALGNHEFDIREKISGLIPLISYNLLSCNTKFTDKHPLGSVVATSKIEEHNGHKYGIIGTTPPDLYQRTKGGITHTEVKVYDENDTIKAIQQEVNKLQKQGIDKIILLSHLGNSLEKRVAKETQGIDVILGGHTHELILDVKEGENLFYSKTGEPVIITQAGRDGKNFGILNLEFDPKGIIKKVQNNIGYTKDFNRNPVVKYIFDKIMSENEVWGKINSAPPALKNDLIDINPHACFVADCMKKELNADVAIQFSANMRGYFEQGDLDTRQLSDILPFKNKLMKVKYTEKELVDAIKFSSKSSLNSASNKPGLLHTSGLNYTINKHGELISMNFIDKDGKTIPIDINRPREDKYYETIVDNYIGNGNDNFTMLNHPERVITTYPFDAVKCIEDFVSKCQNVDIKNDGRITIE